MRVVAIPLVLHEVLGPKHLADVVVEASHIRQRRVPAHRLATRFGQIGNHQRVLEGPGRFEGNPPQKRTVRVRKLHQLHVSGQEQHRLEDGDREADRCRDQQTAEESAKQLEAPAGDRSAVLVQQSHHGHRSHIDESDEQARPDHRGPLLQLIEGEHGGETAGQGIEHRAARQSKR